MSASTLLHLRGLSMNRAFVTADAEVPSAKIQRGVDEFQVHVVIQLDAVIQMCKTSIIRRFPDGYASSPPSICRRRREKLSRMSMRRCRREQATAVTHVLPSRSVTSGKG